jgi:hypothetical protein
MAEQTSHVLPRDGSQNMAEPRPMPVPKPNQDHTAESGLGSFGGKYSDPSTNGHYDETAAFKAAHGTPSPRQRAERGEKVVPEAETKPGFVLGGRPD